jgi:hypothetical protein
MIGTSTVKVASVGIAFGGAVVAMAEGMVPMPNGAVDPAGLVAWLSAAALGTVGFLGAKWIDSRAPRLPSSDLLKSLETGIAGLHNDLRSDRASSGEFRIVLDGKIDGIQAGVAQIQAQLSRHSVEIAKHDVRINEHDRRLDGVRNS